MVAHFHYVVFGTVVFAMFAGFYFWWPKMTGRMLDERLGKLHFWLLFVGFHTHVPGPALARRRGHAASLRRLPARGRLHHAEPGLHDRAFLLGASTLPFLYNVWISRRGPKVEVDDPWGWGRSLEWATSCPPPRHNFVSIPRIRSESPAFDLHHPEIAAIELEQNEAAREGGPADAPDMEGRAEHLGRQSGTPPRRPTRTETPDEGRSLDLRHAAPRSSCWSAPAYWFITGDWTGTSALTMTTLLAAMVTIYLGFHAAKMEPRPEDRKDGEIADGAGELGFFPPYSWWPLWCGRDARRDASSAIAAGAWWLFIIGVVPRRAGPRRLDLRVLPRRARALIWCRPDSEPRVTVPRRAGSCISAHSGPAVTLNGPDHARPHGELQACPRVDPPRPPGVGARAGPWPRRRPWCWWRRAVGVRRDVPPRRRPSGRAVGHRQRQHDAPPPVRLRTMRRAGPAAVPLTKRGVGLGHDGAPAARAGELDGRAAGRPAVGRDQHLGRRRDASSPAPTTSCTRWPQRSDGKRVTRTTRFRTEDLTLDQQTYPSVAPLQGETVGVGMPVIVTFDVPVTDKASIEKHMYGHLDAAAAGHAGTGSATPRCTGARRATGRPAPTSASTSTSTASPAGDGIYGQESRHVDFQVGDAHVYKVNAQTHQMQVFQQRQAAAHDPDHHRQARLHHPLRHQGHHREVRLQADELRDRRHPHRQRGRLRHRQRPVGDAGDLLRRVHPRRPVVGRLPGLRQRLPRLHRHEHRERRLALRT